MRQLTSLDMCGRRVEHHKSAHVAALAVVLEGQEPQPAARSESVTSASSSPSDSGPPADALAPGRGPFGLDYPYWTDDGEFDLEYHVPEIALSSPGSDGSSRRRSPGCTAGRSIAPGPCGSST